MAASSPHPPPLLPGHCHPPPAEATGSASLPWGAWQPSGPRIPRAELLCLGPHRKQRPPPSKQKPRRENRVIAMPDATALTEDPRTMGAGGPLPESSRRTGPEGARAGRLPQRASGGTGRFSEATTARLQLPCPRGPAEPLLGPGPASPACSHLTHVCSHWPRGP